MASKADRIVGTILGAALGDAVGLCTEFLAFTTRWQKSYWFMYNTYIIYDIIFIYIYMLPPPWKVYRFHVVVELKGNLYYILLYYIILYYIILYYILSYFSILQYIIYIYIYLGGGFEYFLCSPLFGEDGFPFWRSYFFQGVGSTTNYW